MDRKKGERTINTSTTVSSFGAMDFSTSSFNLLSIIGLSNSCNFWTSFSVLRAPNSWRNASLLVNCSGSRKLSRENSSFTLFCKGVPDNSTLCSWKSDNELQIFVLNDYNKKLNEAQYISLLLYALLFKINAQFQSTCIY